MTVFGGKLSISNHPKPYIHDSELAVILGGSHDRRYSWVKRALKKGVLTPLKRGIYLIGEKKSLPDAYEIAQQLYGPSYISCLSALAYHGWIPEAVYTTTSVTSKRNAVFQTSIGTFRFERIPAHYFFMGVEYICNANRVFSMAHPWKALADYLYVQRKNWKGLGDAIDDLRLDITLIEKEHEVNLLHALHGQYPSRRVRCFFQQMLKDFRK